MRLLVPPGVFRPRSDGPLLAEHVRRILEPGREVLDVCTGSGILAVAAGLAGAGRVAATDVSRRAVLTARVNGILNGVRIDALRGDLFEPVRGRRFGLIVSNPPYLPSIEDGLPRRGPARAWEGGPDGRWLLDRLIAAAPSHLQPGGDVVVVHSSLCGIETTLQRFDESGLSAAVVGRITGPLGPLLASRAPELERRGLLQPGQREEEVVVIRASDSARRRPAMMNSPVRSTP